MQVREQAARTSTPWTRTALRWLPTFLGFPIGGYAAHLIFGPVDGLAAAIAGGLITGLILGAAQAWSLRFSGPAGRPWIIGTGVAFAAGLGLGSAAVGYGTNMSDLVVQGAVCGLAVGTVQAAMLRPRLGRLAYAWVPALGTLWALGWAITTASGIDVDSQFTVFGSSGALVVTAASVVLPLLLATRSETSAS